MTLRGLALGLSLLIATEATATAAHGDNAVGINVHMLNTALADATAELGVGWVRVDGNWFVMEPSRDRYAWSQMDAAVGEANRHGLQVFMTLAYTPAWVPRHGDTDGQSHNDAPNTSDHWTDFVTEAVRHYRPQGVTHFGIWNEPNLDGFYEGTVEEYASTIAIPGAAAVRTACADCVVLGPDLAHVGDVDDYLERLLQLIPIDTFDIIAHHTYGGFPETGDNIFGGDRFFNALDQQRFPFTRRSLKQILDDAGWTGEVWITETGDRADPPGDAQEEDYQAIHVRRVLEEQLARSWYTNTFFYEILDCRPMQPSCDIDGYGLIRNTNNTPMHQARWPQDFRRKPAFDELKQFIIANPVLSTRPPPPPTTQCSDGADNDGDGRVDLADRGCTNAQDDDESDDPPRRTWNAYQTRGIGLNGDVADFGSDGWIALQPSDWQGDAPLGAGDLEVRAAARWSSRGFFFAFEVTDERHDNDRPDEQLWQGDSIQLAFDVDGAGGNGYAADDSEINFALARGGPRYFRFQGAGGPADYGTMISRQGNVTLYEVYVGHAALGMSAPQAGGQLRLSFLVNDADGSGRAGWSEWTPGIGANKTPEHFGVLSLLADIAAPPPPTPDAGVPAIDAGHAPVDVGFVDTGAVTAPDAGVAIPTDTGVASVTADAATSPMPGPSPISERPAADAAVTPGDPPALEGCRCISASSPANYLGAIVCMAVLGFLTLGIPRRRR